MLFSYAPPFLKKVISPRDIALYTSLCALATFDRADLKERVIEKADFRPFLEYAPEMRQIMKDFYLTKYSKALSELARLKVWGERGDEV
jgi:COP9 signalosome complex subunit 1